MRQSQGEQICGILKGIRRRIAEANEIELPISICRFTGYCSGSCPKCEAELHYLKEKLRERAEAGKNVTFAGMSVALILMSEWDSMSLNQTREPENILMGDIPAPSDGSINEYIKWRRELKKADKDLSANKPEDLCGVKEEEDNIADVL